MKLVTPVTPVTPVEYNDKHFATLGLCLLSLGALAMMLDVEEQQMKTIGLVTTALPLFCITIVLCIMFFVDCGVWKKIQGRKKKGRVGQTKVDVVKVQPVVADQSNRKQVGKNIHINQSVERRAESAWS